ncbi:MAG: caspase family protein [Nitrospiraceae bacterium]
MNLATLMAILSTPSAPFKTTARRSLQVLIIGWIAIFSFEPLQAQLGKPEGLYYKSWAVVIGIENYLVAPKFPGGIDDAKAVAAALRRMGFDEVVEVYDKDASSRKLHHILTDYLPRKVGRQDRVVIFFAGHAATTPDANAKELGYLVPWDAQVNSVSKAVTFDHLKDFSRRTMSKHILFVLDSGVKGWEVTAPQQLSLEGRLAPEEETEKRAVQVLTAGDKGESLVRKDGQSVFVQALIAGLQGAADQNQNGWLMASELGAYVKQQTETSTNGGQHPQFARIDGDGDTILIEGKKASFTIGPEPKTEAERVAAAKTQYEQAFSLLHQQKSAEEALERLNKAIAYDPTLGDAYVLKSYVRLEILPNLDEALSSARLATQYAPKNPDSFYTLGLIMQKRGKFTDAEQAFQQALSVNPNYSDVYYSLGTLYADDLKDHKKAATAFRRYVELGGTDSRAAAAIKQDGGPPAEAPPR